MFPPISDKKNMKTAVILIFCSFLTHAQIPTSGGFRNPPVVPGGPDMELTIGEKLERFNSKITAQERLCSGMIGLISEKTTILETYLRLSTRKALSKGKKSCHEDEILFQCLSTEDIRKDFEVISRHENLIPYVTKTYKISENEAKEIITFFKNICSEIKQ